MKLPVSSERVGVKKSFLNLSRMFQRRQKERENIGFQPKEFTVRKRSTNTGPVAVCVAKVGDTLYKGGVCVG